MTADQLITLIIALVPTLGALAVAWLQSRGKARQAAMLEAVVRGVERGSRVSGTRAIKEAVAEVAAAAGVEGPLREAVARITGDPRTGEPR